MASQLGIGDIFGSALAGLGDFDGDLVFDVAVGMRADDDGGQNEGAVWLLRLHGDRVTLTHDTPSGSDPYGVPLDPVTVTLQFAAIVPAGGAGVPTNAVQLVLTP